MATAKFRGGELRLDEWTRFTELANQEHETRTKNLDEVSDVATEVCVWLTDMTTDPWYDSCAACKKACPDV